MRVWADLKEAVGSQRLLNGHNRGQVLISDLDRLGCSPCLPFSLGCDDGDHLQITLRSVINLRGAHHGSSC